MKKTTLNLIGLSALSLAMSGCSWLYTDNSSDYQDAKAVEAQLKTPEGSKPSRDVMVIPNESAIADLEVSKPFVTPRAPFIFYPMVPIQITEQESHIEFLVPANKKQTQRIVTDFLAALYGAGQSIATQTESNIVSVPFDLHPQGWWASLWSDITRVHPALPAFSFQFAEQEGKTIVSIQYREEQDGVDPTDWTSPIENEGAYSIAVRLWGTIGRQLNQSTAFLSNQDNTSTFPIWINHQGLYSIRLGDDISSSALEKRLNAAGIYLIPDTENLLAPVLPENVARIGDIIDFTIPTGNGETQKLFNVRRRNLNDVSWDEREYSYKITSQKAGNFLVIDVSERDYPEVISFHLAQRFIK